MIVLAAIASSFSKASAQMIIMGPSNVTAGQTYTYTLYDDVFYWSYSWYVEGGYVTNSYQSGSTYYADVHFNSPGPGIVQFLDEYLSPVGTRYVTIQSSCSPPANPSVSFSLTSSTCPPRTLSYTGTPPGGITWYWQTSASGTSMSNSTNSYSVSTTGTYYVRAYNASTQCWSTGAASYYASVSAAPGTPGTISVSTNSCGAKTLTRGTPPGGVTWHWQGTNPNGTNSNSSQTYSATSSGTYYLRAQNNTSGCWSVSSRSVWVSVDNPSTPSTPAVSSNSCGPRTLTRIDPPPGFTWYWQGTNSGGTSTANQAETYNVTTTGTYYIRARNNTSGCWSSGSASVYVSVTNNPQTPNASFSISTNTCGVKTITASGTPPGTDSWHWQGTNPNGTSISGSSYPYGASSTGSYYLRSLNNGCWGSSQSVYVTVDNPPTPNTPISTTASCGPQTLSKNGTPPAGVTWYWQGSNSNGTDYTSANATGATFIASSSGWQYLRARSTAGCWSTSSAQINVSVNPNPSAPTLPSVSSNICGAKTLTKPSAPGGVTYFWQGTNPMGEDYTSATAISNNYTASEHGSTTYYLRTRNNSTGCWSGTSAAITPSVNNPPAPGNGSAAYTEWQTMTLSMGGQAVKWYDEQYNYLDHQGTTYTVDKPVGTYIYRMKAFSGSCESSGYGTFTLNVIYDDTHINWSQSIGYTLDENGNSIPTLASKTYTNGLGNTLQSQTKSYTTNQILATQPIYDRQGNAVLTTLAAPINSSTFNYKHKFVIKDDGTRYKDTDFDLVANVGASGEVFNPSPVGNSFTGTLGWYYSTNNNLEPHVPVSSFPYARSYSPEGPDPRTTKSAGPGEQHKMGSGHEITSEKKQISYEAYEELNHYYAIRAHFIPGGGVNPNKGYKYINTDPNGKQTVSYVDGDGKTLATCTKNGSVHDNWSYTFYNTTGQVVATVAPNGVNTGSTAYPTFITTYKYDHLGRLIETTSTDEGTTQYVYSLDGKIRFSQNQVQRNATPKRFSYTNYDYLGRLIEAGEYTQTGSTPYVFEPHTTTNPNEYSVLTILENNFTVPIHAVTSLNYVGISRMLDNARCTDYTLITYDVQGYNTPAPQSYTYGQVTKTENENTSTWYSYDEFGQVVWMKQNITGLGLKTIEYKYDFLGNVLRVSYQPGQPDRFYHHFIYDADQRLSEVYTSLNISDSTLRAKYHYYLHGPLKRVELANNVQGIDYVYTITGALKTINNADPANDPGNDGANGFAPDVFGQTMHYYVNDYTGADYDAGAQTFAGYLNQYGGALKGVSWHSPVDNNQKRSYAFTYDNLYQLNEATFGNNLSGSFNPNGLDDAYKESIPGYDKNGNIQSLLRKGLNGDVIGNYNYVYEPNTNKLDKVNHNSALLVDYGYNAIGQMTKQYEGGDTTRVYYNAYGITKEVRNTNEQLLVSYHYDDRGDLVKRADYNAGTLVKNTFYVRDASGNPLAIYEGSTRIEVPVYGSGRVALFKPQLNAYFYELGDHLGNVRAVIGAPDTDVYTATMESESQATEQPPFKNISARRAIFVGANNTPGGNEVVRLNNTQPAGPTLALAVSPGDQVNLETWAYYEAGNNYHNTISSTTMIAAIASAFGGVLGAPGEAGEIYSAINDAFTTGGAALGGTGNPNLPGAYMAYLVFDVNRNLTMPLQAGYFRVTTSGNMAKEKISSPTLTMEQPGYIYTFLYNSSNSANWVYFDDFKVTHQRSPIVAGADFYPFGLPMEGREIAQEDYRWGYQGQYAEKDTVTGWNQFQLRMYDARFGRWLSVDPYNQFWSSYVGMGNTPINGVDPDGGLFGKLRAQVAAFFTGGEVWEDLNGNWRVSKSVGFLGDAGTDGVRGTGVRSIDIGNYGPGGLRLRSENLVLNRVADQLNQERIGELIQAGVLTQVDLIKMRGGDGITPVYPETLFLPLPKVLNFGTKTAKAGTQVEQYALRAAEDGFYPVMKRGFKDPKELVWLNKGDVWKFGTTKNPSTRYSQGFLDNTGAGLRYSTEFTGTLQQARILEKMKILNFKLQNSVLPAGNKMVK